MFPWENETQQPRAVAASPSGPENAGNLPCSPNVSFADVLGGDIKHVEANVRESLQAQQASRRAQLEARQAAILEAAVQEDLRVTKEAEVLQACYQHTPHLAPVAGGRMPVRTEHTGISEHPSTRVHAAPGGHSSLSLSDGSAPEASRPAPPPPQPQQQQAVVAGGRMPTRTEHTGISDHPSTRVHAAPGGHSSLSLSDGSVPEASRPRAPPQQQQQAAAAPSYAAAEQHATEQHAAASAIRERARGGSSLW